MSPNRKPESGPSSASLCYNKSGIQIVGLRKKIFQWTVLEYLHSKLDKSKLELTQFKNSKLIQDLGKG
jgi:hypothetical protein